MAESDDAARVCHRWIELYGDGTADTYGSERFLELYAPDCEWFEMPTPMHPGGRQGGPAAIRAAVAENAGFLRDRRVELHDVIADGNRAAMRYTWSALVAADGLPVAAGERVVAEVAAFVQVRNGRIEEIREYVTVA